ncbi:MAG: hypothetical protein U0269_21580 [Polyangiales bacterium]
MRSLLRASLVSLVFVLGACGGSNNPDVVNNDARMDVAQQTDAGSDVASPSDGSVPEASVDASSADAGMCAMSGETCDDMTNPCCAGLACMVRGGAGGTACADPMCRRTGESCDQAHPCCPSSACAGAAGAQTCLPTP